MTMCLSCTIMEISGLGDFRSHDLNLFVSRDVIWVPPAQRKPKLCQCEVAHLHVVGRSCLPASCTFDLPRSRDVIGSIVSGFL